jgi:hypothetical protein
MPASPSSANARASAQVRASAASSLARRRGAAAAPGSPARRRVAPASAPRCARSCRAARSSPPPARAELVLQAPLEGLERRDRGAAVAAQVVQPHQAALGVLGERVAVGQALRIDQAARDRAARLALRRRARQGRVALLVPALARRLQPARQLGQLLELQRAEELVAAGVLVVGDSRQRRRDVGRDLGRELQRRAAADEGRADVAPHPEQALAQVGVGLLAIDRRPKQAATCSDGCAPSRARMASRAASLGESCTSVAAAARPGTAGRAAASARNRRKASWAQLASRHRRGSSLPAIAAPARPSTGGEARRLCCTGAAVTSAAGAARRI